MLTYNNEELNNIKLKFEEIHNYLKEVIKHIKRQELSVSQIDILAYSIIERLQNTIAKENGIKVFNSNFYYLKRKEVVIY